jgi:hypothetical protein
MSKAKKTHSDYKKEHIDLLLKRERLDNEIRDRLLWLSTNYPDAVISVMGDTDIKAKSVANEQYLKTLEISVCILCIQRIEEWLAEQQPVKQTTINFTTDDRICNCDGRDMPVYEEDGKRWCPQCGYEVK